MLPPDAVLVALLLSLSQAAPIDGTWELARIFRSGATAGTRVVPIDSTVYVRLTLETHPGGWMGGRLYRPSFGQPEACKIGTPILPMDEVVVVIWRASSVSGATAPVQMLVS